MLKNITLISMILFLLIGCASYWGALEGERIQKELDGMVNILTFDDALSNWGEPVSVFQGDEVFVVTWGSEKSGVVVLPIGNMVYSSSVSRGWKLVVSFNKTTRRMTSVKYNQW